LGHHLVSGEAKWWNVCFSATAIDRDVGMHRKTSWKHVCILGRLEINNFVLTVFWPRVTDLFCVCVFSSVWFLFEKSLKQLQMELGTIQKLFQETNHMSNKRNLFETPWDWVFMTRSNNSIWLLVTNWDVARETHWMALNWGNFFSDQKLWAPLEVWIL
jgi:hypothetical protein